MRRYITETIQEKTPLLVVGEDTPFRRSIIKNIPNLYADFEGIALGRKPVEALGLTTVPHAIVWVLGGTSQLNAEDQKIRELVEQFGAQLAIVIPEGLQRQASVDERFPNATVLTVPLLEPVEEGVNNVIHAILGESQLKSGVIAVRFPAGAIKTAISAGEGVQPQSQAKKRTPLFEELRKPISPGLDLELPEVESAIVSTPLEKPSLQKTERQAPPQRQVSRPADSRSIEERAAALQSSWSEDNTPAKFESTVRLRQQARVVGDLHVGLGGSQVETELPHILEPPPPMFSHLPSEHAVLLSREEQLGQYAHREVQLVPRPTSGQVSMKHENILTSLFTHDGNYPVTTAGPQTAGQAVQIQRTKTRKEKRRGRARSLLAGLVVVLMVVVFAIGAIAYYLQSFTSAFNTFQGMVLADTPDPDKLKDATNSLSKQIGIVGFINRTIQPITNAVGLGQYSENLDQKFSVAQLEVSTAKALQEYSDSLAIVYASVMGKGNADTAGAILDASVGADKASKQVQILSAELAKDSDNSEIQNTAAGSAGYNKLVGLRRDLLGIQHLFDQLPMMLGKTSKKTYLVLIQNPLELRPTGGFIGAYAIITFEKGKLLDLQVQDSYVADDQLKGQVNPPVDLQKYLSEKQWYFRDSNWDASFPQAAQQAEWFMQKELGVNTDGVVGMNMYSLQSLLKVTGPVQLDAYNNEIVSADNLFERVMTKSELTFSINGGQKKKEYLTSVADAVFEKLKNLDSTGAQKLSASLMQSMASSDILMSVNDKTSEDVLTRLGWSGEIMTPPCPQQFVGNSCFVDTVYEVDTNVGVNRANYYVKKSATHSILLTPQAAVHTYTMRFTNGAVSAAWPSGPYKNYIRLYVPDFAQINSVVVNNKPVSPVDLTQFSEGGKTAVGFYVETPVSGSSEATVNYSTLLSGESAFSYAVFTQKQPGVEPYPLSFSLHVQAPLVVKTLAPQGTITGNVIQIDSTVDKPQYMAVELGK